MSVSATEWEREIPCTVCDEQGIECKGRCAPYDEWWTRRPDMHKETRVQSLIAKSGVLPFLTRRLEAFNRFLKRRLGNEKV